MFESTELLDIKQASIWASAHLGKTVTPANIAYLINYGRIEKIGKNGGVLVSKNELLDYYKALKNSREFAWKDQLATILIGRCRLKNTPNRKRPNTFTACTPIKENSFRSLSNIFSTHTRTNSNAKFSSMNPNRISFASSNLPISNR